MKTTTELISTLHNLLGILDTNPQDATSWATISDALASAHLFAMRQRTMRHSIERAHVKLSVREPSTRSTK